MRHKITSYRQDELTTTHAEYSTEADNDEEAVAKIQRLRQTGHTISSWTQNADQVAPLPKKGKATR